MRHHARVRYGLRGYRCHRRSDRGAASLFRGDPGYRKSGEIFWNDLTFRPEFNADASFRHFIGISRDITRQKNAELKAEKLELDHQFMMENVLSGVVLHNADTEIIYAPMRCPPIMVCGVAATLSSAFNPEAAQT
ncbi:PAS domain-containing protein [Erythromicrobium ramosum]|uniref:PAS domain-containing protein n=2 Tax=Erythrobacter ramosus TaxID=35811 RepID=A0ABR6HW99_9SPHN|nr:PAS domain-containing protein [Erythrobacter ramosus]